MTMGDDDLVIISRQQWHAHPPKIAPEPMSNPVPYVIIHHSYQPSACYSLEECIKAMQWMQDLHQINNTWNDIGYSFAVGSDGRVYEGRGWSSVGAHAPKFNNKSIGICLIGDWRTQLPPQRQLETVQRLINYGIENDFIRCDYELMGHRQVRVTECPGDRLFNEIKHWKHFANKPIVQGDNSDKNNNNNNNNHSLLVQKLNEFNKNFT